jgi:hypothetical protein
MIVTAEIPRMQPEIKLGFQDVYAWKTLPLAAWKDEQEAE